MLFSYTGKSIRTAIAILIVSDSSLCLDYDCLGGKCINRLIVLQRVISDIDDLVLYSDDLVLDRFRCALYCLGGKARNLAELAEKSGT